MSLMIPPPPRPTLFPYTTLFRSQRDRHGRLVYAGLLHAPRDGVHPRAALRLGPQRSEEHTSELQSHSDLVCRLLLEKKKSNLSCASFGVQAQNPADGRQAMNTGK